LRRSAGWSAAPVSSLLLRLPLCSCGYWQKSNGLQAGQRPGGRRYCWPLSWGAFRAGGLPPGGVGGKGPNSSALPQVTGLAPARFKIARVLEFIPLTSAPRQCPPAVPPGRIRNLRSRLRSGLLFTPLTSGNEFPHTMIGGGPEATRRALAAGSR